jgi:ubiquinone/menaquinone biosynthesis C-methylase UbiE
MSEMAIANKSEKPYLPAAAFDIFLPFYDFITKIIGGDKARRLLLNQAHLRPGDRVLDIGCGTGTLAVLLTQSNPDVQVFGLDPDAKALGRAAHKAQKQQLAVVFDQGFADALPYPTASFDTVLSSFMLHHLETDVKEKMLREVRRVLKPGGLFHLLDFEIEKAGSEHSPMRLFHSHKRLKDNSESRILGLMTQAGLVGVKKVESRKAILGLARVGYYEAAAPNS